MVRAWAQRLLVSTVAVALTLGCFELLVLAHLVDFRSVLGTPIAEPWSHPDNLLDPKLLHIREPHYRRRFDGIEYRYDRHGLRNEVDLETADVVVIGDSFVEGWKVSAADLLTAELARRSDLTVANLGQSWYGPQQELELLRRWGVPLHPKACVWAFYEGNDLRDVERYRAATRDWEAFAGRLHTFEQRSFTTNAVLAVRRIVDPAPPGDEPDQATVAKLSGVFAAPGGTKTTMTFLPEWHGPAVPEHTSAALEEVYASLASACELCRAGGAEFLVVFIPTKYRVYGALTTFPPEAEPSRWVVDRLPETLHATLLETLPDAKFLDLTVAFTEEAKRGSMLYFPGWDTHWTPAGHRIAATAIAERLATARATTSDVP